MWTSIFIPYLKFYLFIFTFSFVICFAHQRFLKEILIFTSLNMSRRALSEEDIREFVPDLDSEIEESEDDSDFVTQLSDNEDEPMETDVTQTSSSGNWTVNLGNFIPIIHQFNDFPSGITANPLLSENSPEINFFEHFLNTNIMSEIVKKQTIYISREKRILIINL